MSSNGNQKLKFAALTVQMMQLGAGKARCLILLCCDRASVSNVPNIEIRNRGFTSSLGNRKGPFCATSLN